MKHILDPDFQYTPSHSTDIRRTFERVRARFERARACLRGYNDAIARADLVIEDGRIIKDRDGETVQ